MAGCVGFSYKYYGMYGIDYSKGTLLGEKPEDDLAFSKCEPSSTSKYPCVIMFAPEFMKMKQDYLDTQKKLELCEKGKG